MSIAKTALYNIARIYRMFKLSLIDEERIAVLKDNLWSKKLDVKDAFMNIQKAYAIFLTYLPRRADCEEFAIRMANLEYLKRECFSRILATSID
jgi:hypothetical protein